MVAAWENLTEAFINMTVNGVTRFTANELLSALLDAQREELALLQSLHFKVDLLLRADYMAAYEYLEYARLRMKTQDYDQNKPKFWQEMPEDAARDVRKAQEFYIRAINQHPELQEAAVIHRDIAMCAGWLRDMVLASHELERAKQAAQKWVSALEAGSTKYHEHLKKQSAKNLFLNEAAGMVGWATIFAFVANPLLGGAVVVTYGVAVYSGYKNEMAAWEVVNKQKELASNLMASLDRMKKEGCGEPAQ